MTAKTFSIRILQHLELTLAVTLGAFTNWTCAMLMASLAQQDILRAMGSRTLDDASEECERGLRHIEALSKSMWVGEFTKLQADYSWRQHQRSEAQARDALISATRLAMCPVDCWLSAIQGSR